MNFRIREKVIGVAKRFALFLLEIRHSSKGWQALDRIGRVDELAHRESGP